MNTLKVILFIIKTFELISSIINAEISSNKFSLSTKNFHIKKILIENNSPINSLTVLKNGNIVSGHQDSTIKIWNLTDASLKLILSGHADIVNSLVVLENEYLVSGSWDTTIKIWNTNNGKLIRTLRGHSDYVRALVLLQNNILASASDDRTIKIWNPNEGLLVKTLKGHLDFVRALVELPNGDLASGSDDGTIKIWDIYEGTAKKTLIGHSYWISPLLILPNDILASGSIDFTIKLWNMNDWGLVENLKAHQSPIQFLIILKNGDWASFSEDKTTIIWNAKNNSIKETLKQNYYVKALTSLPNGDIVVAYDDGSIKVWLYKDISSPEWVRSCQECQKPLNQCIDDNCWGEEACKECIHANYSNCSECLAEIFQESSQITLPDNRETIICDINNQLHITVCNFFCRSLFKLKYKCEIISNMPICTCIDITLTTSSTYTIRPENSISMYLIKLIIPFQ